MADVTPILIKDLEAQTTLQDTDYFIVGGEDAKKITVGQMKEALGINELNTNIENVKIKENKSFYSNHTTPLGAGDTYCYKQNGKLFINFSFYITSSNVYDKGKYVSIAQLENVSPRKTIWLPAVFTLQPETITGGTDTGTVEFGAVRINATGNIHVYIPESVTKSINCIHVNAVIDLAA